jgi:hypothetical protein
LKSTDKVFEVLPDSLLPVQFGSLQVPVITYSPYHTGINGTTQIEVTKESKEFNLNLDIAGETEVWPTLTYGTAEGGDANATEKGEVMLEYTTSKISGEFTISSILTGSSGVSDSETILVSVEPDFLNFASLGTERWNLTGNTGTTSYSKCDGTQINHAQNHYASQKLYGNLYNALIDFYEWSGMPRSEGGYGEFIKVGLNDMSLPKGGLFDICSDWGGGNKKKGIIIIELGQALMSILGVGQ